MRTHTGAHWLCQIEDGKAALLYTVMYEDKIEKVKICRVETENVEKHCFFGYHVRI